MKCFYLFLAIYSSQLFGQSDLQRKFPATLLTNDYGILTTADLIADPALVDQALTYPAALAKWQCFKTKDVIFNYETWKAPNPMGDENINVNLCLFSIRVKNVDPIHYYGGRRAYLLAVCEGIQSSWRTISSGQAHICLNGYNDGRLKKIKRGRGFQYETSWTWVKFKSRKGCGGGCS